MSTKSKPVWIQFATERQVQDLFPSQAKLTGVSSKGFEWTAPNWLMDLLENAQARENTVQGDHYA